MARREPDPRQVETFSADYGPRLIAGGLAALTTLLLWAPLLSPRLAPASGPALLGARLGLGLAVWAACAWLFRREARHKLEVGPVGLSVRRGRVDRSFTWDQFDSFAAPARGTLVLRTRDRELITLQGWHPVDQVVPLVLHHLERQLAGKGAPPDEASTRH